MASLGLGSSSAAGSTDSVQSRTINQQDFLRILSTQLTFQDPLKPIDNEQFMAQMAQFSSLEQSRMSNDKLDTLLSLQAANQSLGLIGKTVEIATDNGSSVTGQVSTITFQSGQPQLTVKQSNGELLTGISLSQVSLVQGSGS
jgi:flagellar basal-body rod modification protein FlgD